MLEKKTKQLSAVFFQLLLLSAWSPWSSLLFLVLQVNVIVVVNFFVTFETKNHCLFCIVLHLIMTKVLCYCFCSLFNLCCSMWHVLYTSIALFQYECVCVIKLKTGFQCRFIMNALAVGYSGNQNHLFW